MNRAASSRNVAAVALAWSTIVTACTENNYFGASDTNGSDDISASTKRATTSSNSSRKRADSGTTKAPDASPESDAGSDTASDAGFSPDASGTSHSVPCTQDGEGASPFCSSSSAAPICCSAVSGTTRVTKCVKDADACAALAAPLPKPLSGVFYVECTKNADCAFPETCRVEAKAPIHVVRCIADTSGTLQACTSPLECTGGCLALSSEGVSIGYCF
mgnify:CR=1 FL=1